MSTKSSDIRFAIVSTDIILLRENEGDIEFGVMDIDRPPYYVHMEGFVGGVLRPEETALMASHRILEEKTSIKPSEVQFFPLGFYDDPKRDERGRVVALAYLGILTGSGEEYGLTWYPLYKKAKFAYDHTLMLRDTIEYLKSHLYVSTIALAFLPKHFVVSKLKAIFDYIEGEEIDKRNFYKFLDTYPVEKTKELQSEGRGRPALIYKKKQTKAFFLSKK